MQIARVFLNKPLTTNGLATNHPHSEPRRTHNHGRTQLLHLTATPANMAQLARKRRFRKSPPSTGHSATPRRNSRRMTYTKTFRFNDLTSELRDMIYTFALQDKNNSRLELIRQLPSTAKALRQVSRAVGAASLAVYYSKNLFEVNLDCGHYMICDDIEFINGWISVFCGFAVHHLRSIRIYIIANGAHRG